MPYAIAIVFGLAYVHPGVSGLLAFAFLGGWYYDKYMVPRLGRPVSSPPDMSPTEYERYCAQVLEESGWECILTPASGDHGVDIVARKDGRVLAIQAMEPSGQ